MQPVPYPGYARGPYATHDRCPGCGRLIGHGALATRVEWRWWHESCYRKHLEKKKIRAKTAKRYWYPLRSKTEVM